MTETVSTTGDGPPAWVPRLPPAARLRMVLILRIGLLASLAILAASVVAYLVQHPGTDFRSVVGSNPILEYLGLPGLAHGLLTGSVEAYLTLGLLVLVATPILRVASGLYYFSRDRERALTEVTLTVLVLLIVGLLVIGPFVR